MIEDAELLEGQTQSRHFGLTHGWKLVASGGSTAFQDSFIYYAKWDCLKIKASILLVNHHFTVLRAARLCSSGQAPRPGNQALRRPQGQRIEYPGGTQLCWVFRQKWIAVQKRTDLCCSEGHGSWGQIQEKARKTCRTSISRKHIARL